MKTSKSLSVPSIQQIERILSEDPLVAIDLIIQRARKLEEISEEQEQLFDYSLQAIIALAGKICPENINLREYTRSILDDTGSIRKSRLLSACFLRLLPVNAMRMLHDNPWRPRIISLLDISISDVYDKLHIEKKLQAHEKIRPLIEAVEHCDKDFESALKSLTSLELLKRHRTKTMKALNASQGQLLIKPFLPDSFDSRLTELYTRVNSYIEERQGLGVVDAYERAEEEIQAFIELTAEKGTLYSLHFSKLVGEKLSTLIKDDFSTNKAVQPAALMVRISDKKHPLHFSDYSIQLEFVIRNDGPGYANNVALEFVVDDTILGLVQDEVEFGRIAPLTEQVVDISAKVRRPVESATILMAVRWNNFDGNQIELPFEFFIYAQQKDVDWELLSKTDPYSLEPVTSFRDLVGRRDVLNRLIATASASSAGSSVIFGQKRVGKTSIAATLRSQLSEQGYLVVFLEGGDYVQPSAQSTVACLGEVLATKIQKLDKRLSHIKIPAFDDALSPLAQFLDDVNDILPNRRLIIILDEFDELPASLYARGPIGDAFFLTLRSISSRQDIGILVVGGEKIRNIMDSQGDQLNKWNVIPVDYFDRSTDWIDFKELVQRPVTNSLEYTEDALVSLHEYTAGNPYFTKLICQNVFRTAIERRDCHITKREILDATKATVSEAKSNTFQHFWEDGILEAGDRGKEKSVRRRKILIAVSDSSQFESGASKERLSHHRLVTSIPTLDSDLTEFVSRKILISEIGDSYSFKVKLFHEWLKTRGVQDIITEFADLDGALKARQREETLKVKSAEIVALARIWGAYKGQEITEDRIRAWLEQFETVQEQRLMFSILANLNFYSNAVVRNKLVEVHNMVQRGLVRYLKQGQVKRSDILVSYLDGPSKSGVRYARLYADEADIYVKNIVEKGSLNEEILRDEIKALVFVDDFVCTGDSAIEYLSELDDLLAERILEREIKVVFVAVVALAKGWERVEQFVEDLRMPVIIRACELIGEEAQCFSEKSKYFASDEDREDAKAVANKYGRHLEKDRPFGYGNLGLAVVFERNCPNNTLPIIWKETSTWAPLFKR